ncbi:OadG family protein [Lachnoclostridium phytofermentans]|uniref:Sodium pump decarboxylase gamma subunit n=1 Tax=Lachnoclostridium phytofermentans (strain ATCC 700394 / DSM 18823 / ISDg) TaxID=357809 RepID=A9KLQ3_LACP7|nr:OadG family protein [Lachnoclostridium phytofermentans]ABX42797.1 sodium pump decarboxylase gamma subunit [Lachnoclostridium phytofermentans ISDg]
METALLNTVMGMSIVFLVLWLISGIIGLFKYINKLEIYLKQKKKSIEIKSETVSSQPVDVEEIDVAEDLDLVAVITAAIHAYEASNGNPVPENGLYVRSIRKLNKSRWQNA